MTNINKPSGPSADIHDAQATARILVQTLRTGGSSPDNSSKIDSLASGLELKAGLHLLNGNWERAHQIVQPLPGALAAHWHGIIHRREPDYPNAKYWYRRIDDSPVFEHLLVHAKASGKDHLISTGVRWDALKFIDCCSDPENDSWTQPLDQLEVEGLLNYCLELEG